MYAICTTKLIIMTIKHIPASKNYICLTYIGIIKVLFSLRCGNADAFQKWATEKLFTIQLGGQNNKDTLSALLLGINTKTVKDVFKTNNAKTPCVCLFLIGKAKDLFEGKYHEDDLICKYGCTDDLPRRASEYERNQCGHRTHMFFNNRSTYIFDAEKSIRKFFENDIFEYTGSKELIKINKKIGQARQHFIMVQNSYIGRFKEMNDKIICLEKEIVNL